MRHFGILITISLAMMVCASGCKKDDSASAPGGTAAEKPATEGSEATSREAKWVRPTPYESPDAAFQALFEALQDRDMRAIEATLVSRDECMVLVGKNAERCARVASQRKLFLEAIGRAPLPKDAHVTNVLLLKSVVLDEKQGLNRPIRIQPGIIGFKTEQGQASIGGLAAIEVVGGWRIQPGKPVMKPMAPSEAAKPGAAKPGAAKPEPVAVESPTPTPTPTPTPSP